MLRKITDYYWHRWKFRLHFILFHSNPFAPIFFFVLSAKKPSSHKRRFDKQFSIYKQAFDLLLFDEQGEANALIECLAYSFVHQFKSIFQNNCITFACICHFGFHVHSFFTRHCPNQHFYATIVIFGFVAIFVDEQIHSDTSIKSNLNEVFFSQQILWLHVAILNLLTFSKLQQFAIDISIFKIILAMISNGWRYSFD